LVLAVMAEVVLVVQGIVHRRRPAFVLLLTQIRDGVRNVLDRLLIAPNVLYQQAGIGLGN